MIDNNDELQRAKLRITELEGLLTSIYRTLMDYYSPVPGYIRLAENGETFYECACGKSYLTTMIEGRMLVLSQDKYHDECPNCTREIKAVDEGMTTEKRFGFP